MRIGRVFQNVKQWASRVSARVGALFGALGKGSFVVLNASEAWIFLICIGAGTGYQWGWGVGLVAFGVAGYLPNAVGALRSPPAPVRRGRS